MLPTLDHKLETLRWYHANIGGEFLLLHSIHDGACTCSLGAACDKSPGKHPMHNGGVYSATDDLDVLEAQLRKHPRANVGMRCGTKMRDGRYIVVIDVDPRNGGDASLVDLEMMHGVPETLTQDTGGKGEHLIFGTEDPCASGAPWPGIELIGDRKYIVLAGSNHLSGGVYSVRDGAVPVADAPSWVVSATTIAGSSDVNVTGESGLETYLGEALVQAGKLARDVVVNRDGSVNLACPWAHEHSDARGQGNDDSTVLLGKVEGSSRGGFRCLHSHCAHRNADDVLSTLPANAVAAAARKYPHPGTIEKRKSEAPMPVDYETQLDEMWDKCQYKQLAKGVKLKLNAVTLTAILSEHPDWQNVIQFDEFSVAIRLVDPPWHPDDAPAQNTTSVTDGDIARIKSWLLRLKHDKFDAFDDIPTTAVYEAVRLVAEKNSHNPLQHWLAQQQWDGRPRVEKWTHDYLGCEDTEYHRIAGRKWLISAVARAMSPGCKADHVLILEGKQGRGKSSALAALVPVTSWFNDTPLEIGNKDAYVALRGKWIVELGELASLKKADTEKAKAFFSSPTDSFRPPFGKTAQDFPRQCVFAGTVNPNEYLTDPTGNRRYWPVKCGIIDLQGLRADAPQLWAEAMHMYSEWVKRGSSPAECLWWPSYEEQALFGGEAKERVVNEDEAWTVLVTSWLAGPKAGAELAEHGHVTATVILALALDVPKERQDKRAVIRVGQIMSHVEGWSSRRAKLRGTKTTIYEPRGQAR